MKNIREIVKDFIISGGISIVTIFFLEVSFRTAKFVRNKMQYVDKSEEVFRDRFIAFDKKLSIDDLKARNDELIDKLMYKPWIQIGNYDHNGKYSNVIDGSRLVKDSELLKDCVSKKEIWMFGGSTTYGVGVPYSENIPTFLQKILNQQNACMKVINYGVPYHYSKQETINFVNNLLKEENPPSVAIFLDGLNDFGQPGSTLAGEPFFTDLLTSIIPKGNDPYRKRGCKSQNLFNLEIISFLQKKIFKNTYSGKAYFTNYDLPKNYTNESAAKEISELFIKNTISLGKICEAYNVQCFRFLQPVAAVDYTPPENDALTIWVQDEEKKSRYKIGYSLIRNFTNKNFLGINLIDISYLFKDYSGIPYVDGGHYAPRANKLIAEFIYTAISPINNHE